jgi:hypothetical protein
MFRRGNHGRARRLKVNDLVEARHPGSPWGAQQLKEGAAAWLALTALAHEVVLTTLLVVPKHAYRTREYI